MPNGSLSLAWEPQAPTSFNPHIFPGRDSQYSHFIGEESKVQAQSTLAVSSYACFSIHLEYLPWGHAEAVHLVTGVHTLSPAEPSFREGRTMSSSFLQASNLSIIMCLQWELH